MNLFKLRKHKPSNWGHVKAKQKQQFSSLLSVKWHRLGLLSFSLFAIIITSVSRSRYLKLCVLCLLFLHGWTNILFWNLVSVQLRHLPSSSMLKRSIFYMFVSISTCFYVHTFGWICEEARGSVRLPLELQLSMIVYSLTLLLEIENYFSSSSV